MSILYLRNKIIEQVIKISLKMSTMNEKFRGFNYNEDKSLQKGKDDNLN